jgi:predicted transcriptional regulator
MKQNPLADILERAESWPAHVRDELADFARELEAGVNGDAYQPTLDELAGIDRGLRAADDGRFANDDDVAAVFAKYRGH